MTTDLDMGKLEEFAGKLFGIYIDTGLSFMIDIGHRTGLFDALAEGGTSQEIADRAGLSERHVREWLGAMVTGGIATYDPGAKTYALPPEHAACLTGDNPSNLAKMAQFGTFIAKHVPAVARTFQEGGGIPYSAYRPEFTDLMDTLGRDTYDALLISGYLPAAEGLVDRLTSGIRVADLGCGAGHTTNLMAQAFPSSTFVGFDFADDAIAAATKEAESMDLSNVSFEVRDVRDLPKDPPFDLITAFDAIHDQADPARVLREAQEALAPGGTLFVVDIDASSNLEENIGNPMAPWLYVASTMHCMQVSLAMDGAGLGTAWGRQLATEMMQEAGFSSVEIKDTPPEDPANIIYLATKA